MIHSTNNDNRGIYAGYIRVSAVNGREGDRFRSAKEQAVEIEAWAKRTGREVILLKPDLDAKGADPNRRVLRDAVANIKAGRYAGLVVAYLSRAGRNMRLVLDLWDEIENAGGTVHCARENIDTSTASGRLLRNILASVAEMELEERRTGFAIATSNAVERGIWPRLQVPRGYKKDPATRRLVVDEETADEVKAAFSDKVAGGSISSIAKKLGLSRGGACAMLQNRTYLGEVKVGKYINRRAHEPLIDAATFAAAGDTFQARVPRAAKVPALLAGLVRCASCGHAMTRDRAPQGNRVSSYVCYGRHRSECCPQPACVSAHLLEGFVDSIARAELTRMQAAAPDRDLERAKDALAGAEAELTGYLTAVSVAEVGQEAFNAGAKQRQEEVSEARRTLQRKHALHPSGPATALDGEGFGNLAVREKNRALHAMIHAVVVAPANGRRKPVSDRVRVLGVGADVPLARRNGPRPGGIVPIPLPEPGAAKVLAPEAA